MKLISEGGELYLYKNFLDPALAQDLFMELLIGLPWESPQIRLFGKSYPIPREEVWVGDPGCHYTYSGKASKIQPWNTSLKNLRLLLRRRFDIDWNSVLVIHYRDGKDKNGFHSDDEIELGPEPTICSLSFGESRYFDLKNKWDPELKYRLELNHNDLVVMTGPFQQNWKHSIPQQKRIQNSRINLTFRTIY